MLPQSAEKAGKKVRRTYIYTAIFFTTLLIGSSVASITYILQWNHVTSDGKIVRFTVKEIAGLKGGQTSSLLWSSILVIPMCFTGVFLLCFRRKFMIVLMIITGIVGFVSSGYSCAIFNGIYKNMNRIIADDDFDDRCDSRSINDINYCECKIGQLGPSGNETNTVLRFRVDECDDLQKERNRFYLLFILSLTTSLLSVSVLIFSIMAYRYPYTGNSRAALSNTQTVFYDSTGYNEAGLHQNRLQTEGFRNPVFIQHGNTSEKRRDFWYPYSGSPNANSQDGLGYDVDKEQRNSQITFSSFRKGYEERIM